MIKIMNLQKDKAIIFDNKDFVLNELDLGNADIDFETYKANYQIGKKITSRNINTRDISIVGYVLATNETEMLDKKRFLQRVLNPFEDFYLIINGYQIRVSAKESIKYAVEKYRNNGKMAHFLIKGLCANPFFSKIKPDISTVGVWEGRFHFPLHMTTEEKSIMGVRRPSQIKMINNMGEAPIGMKIKFTATANNVLNPYILDLKTRKKIKINIAMNKNDSIMINTNYGEKSIIRNGKEDIFYLLDLDSDFINLIIGENYLKCGAEGNELGLNCEIEYSPQFLEV